MGTFYPNLILHKQNNSLFCMIGVFKDPKVSSSTYLQKKDGREFHKIHPSGVSKDPDHVK